MDQTTSSSGITDDSPALSTGLGGALWVFAWALAAAPTFLTPLYATWQWQSLPSLGVGGPHGSYNSVMWVWRLLFVIVLWRAAMLFFRRAAGFPLAWLALVAVLWSGAVAHELFAILLSERPEWRWSMLIKATISDHFLLTVSIAATLYLWLSPHARGAFRGGTAATRGTFWLPDILRDGPNDWSRGVWLIPGLLMYAALVHATGAVDLAAEALQPMPAPERHVTVEIVLLGTASREHVQAARLQWGLHLLALSLLPFVCHAFVRRRPRTVWLVVALLSITIAAPLVWIVIDPPPIYLDGPDHEAELLSAIVLSLIVLPALWSARKRGRFGHASGSSPRPAPNEPLSDAAQGADH